MVAPTPSRHTLRTLGLVLSVLVAGCGGFGGPETSTVSPAPVPEDPTVAPGIPAQGPVDAASLLAADADGRGVAPVRIVDVVTVQGPGQQFSVRRTIDRLSPNRTAVSYLYTRGRYVEPLFVSETSNGSARTVSTVLQNGTVRVNESLPPSLRARLPPVDLTERLLTSGTFELVDRAEGRLHLASRGSLTLRGVVPPAFEEPRNATAFVRVTPAGRITWVDLDLEAVHEGRSVSVTLRRDVEPNPENATWDAPGPAPPTDR